MTTLATLNTDNVLAKVQAIENITDNKKLRVSLADAVNKQDIESITAHMIDFLNREQSSEGLTENTQQNYITAASQYLSYCFDNGVNVLRPTPRQAQNYKKHLAQGVEVQTTRRTSKRIDGKVKKITVDWYYGFDAEGKRVKLPLPTETRTLSPSSINRNLGVAKSLHRAIISIYLADEENKEAVSNPFDLVKNVKARPADKEAAYSDEDRELLLARATGDMKLIIALCGYGGLRVSEALTLAWATVDLSGDTLTITEKHSKNKTEGTIVLVPELKEILSKQKNKTGNVIKKQLTRFNVYQKLKTICKQCGVRFKGIHGLRHAFLQNTLDSTHSREVTMVQGRHKSYSSSERYAQTGVQDVKRILLGDG